MDRYADAHQWNTGLKTSAIGHYVTRNTVAGSCLSTSIASMCPEDDEQRTIDRIICNYEGIYIGEQSAVSNEIGGAPD